MSTWDNRGAFIRGFRFLTQTHLVVHSSSSLERSLREALCFSSNRSFSVLAASIKTFKYEREAVVSPMKLLWMHSWQNSDNLYVYVRRLLPMSPFSIALMSGLSRQSVGARSLSMPGSSSFSVMAKLVKLYICREKEKWFTVNDLIWWIIIFIVITVIIWTGVGWHRNKVQILWRLL